MRPERLVLENFASFRGRHEVDFSGLDLFVLSGPTGAGKSSVIDAITCALYGSVARYDDVRLIEPAIHKLATQAKLSVTFAADGARYVVTRLLRRTPAGGAHAAEVRLERYRSDGSTTTLASGSREVLAAVQDLLGLTFDEFCKTVVLPQGAFAAFLHGARQERQDLLVRLLGLDVYRRLGALARGKASRLGARVDDIDARLASLSGIDDAAVERAEARAGELEAVRREVVGALWPRLDRLREAGAEARQRAEAAAATVRALEAVSRPAGVDALGGRLRAGDEQVRAATDAVERARAALAEARRRLADAPAAEPLTELLRVDDELGGALAEAVETAEQASASAGSAAAADRDAAEAESVAAEATDAVSGLERAHAAHTLAAGLRPGEDCPVCLRPVEAAPEHPEPAGLGEARHAAERAAERARRRREAATKARSAADRAEARAQAAAERAERLAAALGEAADACGLPLIDGRADRPTARARLEAQREAKAGVDAAERALSGAEAALRQAEARRRGLDDQARAAWDAFTRTRDTVAHLGAPQPDRDDPHAAWDALVAWTAERLRRARAEQAEADSALAAARRDWEQHAEAIRSAVTEAGVALPGPAPERAVDALAGAATAAANDAARKRDELAQAAALRGQRADAQAGQRVAEMLGDLLRRDGFEQWLLNRLSSRLVAGASHILDELTQGAFSLAVDAGRGSFEVVDHRNADERRPAKTLSGGETFLASLALALALAEHVAHVNAQGAARLDALFIDEGFGTLDPEALDTVAAAIEELSGQRMVAVVTHVAEFASRMPARFDVRRGPQGSTIRLAAPDAAGLLDGDPARPWADEPAPGGADEPAPGGADDPAVAR